MIVSHPDNQLGVMTGSDVTFSVDAEGLRLSFSWQREDEDSPLTTDGRVIGTYTNTLTILDVKRDDAGLYACQVSNRAGRVWSDDAVLSIQLGKLDLHKWQSQVEH